MIAHRQTGGIFLKQQVIGVREGQYQQASTQRSAARKVHSLVWLLNARMFVALLI